MTHSQHAPLGSASRFFYEIQEGSRRQANVIFALIFKEMKTKSGADGYGLISMIGALFESTLTVLALWAFWYLARRQEISGVSVGLFLSVSYIPFAMVRRSLSSVPKAMQGGRAFYAFPGVKPIDTILARFILELALTIIGGAMLLFILAWVFGDYVRTDKLFQGLLIFVAIIALALGQSLFVGVYGTKFPMIFKFIQLISRGIFILSAVMHPMNELPPETQAIIAWNPVANYLELIRYYLLGLKPYQDVSLNYAMAYTVFILFLGFAGYWVNRIKVLER